MKTFVIQATQITPTDKLDYDDQEDINSILAEFVTRAENADDALGNYHETIPVACLDDFEFEAEEMLKSEILKREAEQEDNDFRALNLYKKSMREDRIEKFEDKWLSKFEDKYEIQFNQMQQCYIITTEEYGVLHFYPKANRLQFQGSKNWYSTALRWMISKLL